jgi:hypothetical protein
VISCDGWTPTPVVRQCSALQTMPGGLQDEVGGQWGQSRRRLGKQVGDARLGPGKPARQSLLGMQGTYAPERCMLVRPEVAVPRWVVICMSTFVLTLPSLCMEAKC